MVGEKKFRKVMGHFATGVTVVTAQSQAKEPVGLTVNAFTSVSLDPPLILVCIHREADAHDVLVHSGRFVVNLLQRDQETLALRFAKRDPLDRFRGLELIMGSMGAPLLPDALGWLQCSVRHVYPGGDHSIIVGEVMECEARDASPLLFHRGDLRGLEA